MQTIRHGVPQTDSSGEICSYGPGEGKAYYMALLHHALGMREEALAELGRAREEQSYTLLLLPLDPNADALRDESLCARG